MADERSIDARWACLMVERLKDQRIPVDTVLKEAGLSRRQVSDPDARIPYQKHAALLVLSAAATGDGSFGLHLTTTIEPKEAGVLGYVLLNSATLGDALANLVRYFRVLTDALEFDLDSGPEEVVMASRVTDPLVQDRRQLVECELGLLYRFCQLITGREIALRRVEFQYGAPKQAPTVRQIFRAPIHYHQEKNAIAFDAGILDLPIETADSKLLKILKRHCELMLGARPETVDLAFEVRQLIANQLPSGQPRIDAVARELGMSARTLNRRLAADGLNYKGLLDQVRHKLAIQYLKDRQISVAQVAYLLGYSEVSAFYHAFRRWTDASPGKHRLKTRATEVAA